MALEQRQHAVIDEIGGCDRCLAIIELGTGDLAVGIDAVRLYKDPSEVERCFANLKDVIDMRPVYHQTADRVEAHIFVAALAFLVHRAIEKNLKAARLDLSATEALTILKSIRVVDIDLGNGTESTRTR
jgi:transposase